MYILTSVWVLRIPNASWNMLFVLKTKKTQKVRNLWQNLTKKGFFKFTPKSGWVLYICFCFYTFYHKKWVKTCFLLGIKTLTSILYQTLLPLPEECEALLPDVSAGGWGNGIWTGMEFSIPYSGDRACAILKCTLLGYSTFKTVKNL